jgi:hypothetical protein
MLIQKFKSVKWEDVRWHYVHTKFYESRLMSVILMFVLESGNGNKHRHHDNSVAREKPETLAPLNTPSRE